MLDAIKKLLKKIGLFFLFLLELAIFVALVGGFMYINLKSCADHHNEEGYTEEEIEDMQDEYDFNRYRHP